MRNPFWDCYSFFDNRITDNFFLLKIFVVAFFFINISSLGIIYISNAKYSPLLEVRIQNFPYVEFVPRTNLNEIH